MSAGFVLTIFKLTQIGSGKKGCCFLILAVQCLCQKLLKMLKQSQTICKFIPYITVKVSTCRSKTCTAMMYDIVDTDDILTATVINCFYLCMSDVQKCEEM